MTSRAALFKKSTRKNQEFERFLCYGQEAAILDATISKYIPLSYFVTPNDQQDATAATAATDATAATSLGSSSGASGVGGRTPPRTSTRRTHGLADKMPFESFRLINVQQRGDHAHSLVLFKSRAITTNPEQIAIFECNGQLQQSEIRVIHTSAPPKAYTESDSDSDSDEPGTVYDVTQIYFSPVSPKVCLNYGNDKHNPGYCGMFGIIAMVFFRGVAPPNGATSFDNGAGVARPVEAGVAPPNGATTFDRSGGKERTRWINKWTQLLKYMRQEIPNEPECRGCMGINLAARVQEIIAAHPSTATAHRRAEKEVMNEIKQALRTMKKHK